MTWVGRLAGQRRPRVAAGANHRAARVAPVPALPQAVLRSGAQGVAPFLGQHGKAFGLKQGQKLPVASASALSAMSVLHHCIGHISAGQDAGCSGHGLPRAGPAAPRRDPRRRAGGASRSKPAGLRRRGQRRKSRALPHHLFGPDGTPLAGRWTSRRNGVGRPLLDAGAAVPSPACCWSVWLAPTSPSSSRSRHLHGSARTTPRARAELQAPLDGVRRSSWSDVPGRLRGSIPKPTRSSLCRCLERIVSSRRWRGPM